MVRPKRGSVTDVVSAPERTDARANRQRILEAALEIIAERGAAAEIKDVAERAGVGIGTIYRNFATKDDLVRGIIQDMLRRFYEVRDAALAIDDPVESVRAYIHGMFAILEQWSPVVVAMMSGAFTEDIKDGILAFIRDRKLEAVFHRGIALGVFRKDLQIELARGLLVNACDPVIYMAVQEQVPREEIAAGYSDLILRSIRA